MGFYYELFLSLRMLFCNEVFGPGQGVVQPGYNLIRESVSLVPSPSVLSERSEVNRKRNKGYALTKYPLTSLFVYKLLEAKKA